MRCFTKKVYLEKKWIVPCYKERILEVGPAKIFPLGQTVEYQIVKTGERQLSHWETRTIRRAVSKSYYGKHKHSLYYRGWEEGSKP